jgi:hypothetical protein
MTEETSASMFCKIGRRIATQNSRVFDVEPLDYYHIANKEISFPTIIENYKSSGYLPNLTPEKFQHRCEELKQKLSQDDKLRGLLNGVHVPFALPRLRSNVDLSESTIQDKLIFLEKSFTSRYPQSHFKGIMQGGTTLNGNLRIASESRYSDLISCASKGSVVGWYFPQALQQFDIASQIEQMNSLPLVDGLCLSGPAEIFSALIGKPDLLINENGYSPILCMSALQHTDQRLALAIKSYGPHLEFWCLSQMLVPGIKQVSEQWSGGITFYCSIPQNED